MKKKGVSTRQSRRSLLKNTNLKIYLFASAAVSPLTKNIHWMLLFSFARLIGLFSPKRVKIKRAA
jgi:hypothetical protein